MLCGDGRARDASSAAFSRVAVVVFSEVVVIVDAASRASDPAAACDIMAVPSLPCGGDGLGRSYIVTTLSCRPVLSRSAAMPCQ
jgi:hypothetical protein